MLSLVSAGMYLASDVIPILCSMLPSLTIKMQEDSMGRSKDHSASFGDCQKGMSLDTT